MSNSCDNTGNNSGNFGVGPGVPNPNKEEILRPENNLPEARPSKDSVPYEAPPEREGKRYRPLGSFAHNPGKTLEDIPLPQEQNLKNATEIHQPISKTGKDEAEPDLPDSRANKDGDFFVQPESSDEKVAVTIGSTDTRPNKNTNEVLIGENSSSKEITGISTPESTQKDVQSLDLSTRPEIKVGDTIIPASTRQTKNSSLEIGNTRQQKGDTSVPETNNRVDKEGPEAAVDSDNRWIKTGSTVTAEAASKSAKIGSENEIDARAAFLSPKELESLSLPDDKSIKDEEEVNPSVEFNVKSEVEFDSTEASSKDEQEVGAIEQQNQKGEVELDSAASTEKGEVELDEAKDGELKIEEPIDDTSPTKKGEVEIASTAPEKKGEKEVDDVEENASKGEEEISDDSNREEKNFDELGPYTDHEYKGLQEVSEDSNREEKPNTNEVETPAGSAVGKDSIPVSDSETSQKTNYQYDIQAPMSGQINENNYLTSEPARNKDAADDDKAQNTVDQVDAGKNVKFTDDDGNLNDTSRKIKDSGTQVTAESGAGFPPGTTDGIIDEVITNSKAQEYKEDVFNVEYMPENNSNANYKYHDKNDDFNVLESNIDINRATESNIGNFDKTTPRRDTTENAPSNVGVMGFAPDQYSERFDYDSTLESNDKRTIKGSGEGKGALDTIAGSYTATDKDTHKELYPNDPVSLPSSGNRIDKKNAGIVNENWKYDDGDSESDRTVYTNQEYTYDGIDVFPTLTERKADSSEIKNTLGKDNDQQPQVQTRFNYADNIAGKDNIQGTRNSTDNGGKPLEGVKHPNGTTVADNQVGAADIHEADIVTAVAGGDNIENNTKNSSYGDDNVNIITSMARNPKLDGATGTGDANIDFNNYTQENDGFDKTSDSITITNTNANNDIVAKTQEESSPKQETSNTNYNTDVERRFNKGDYIHTGEVENTWSQDVETNGDEISAAYSSDYTTDNLLAHRPISGNSGGSREKLDSNIKYNIQDFGNRSDGLLSDDDIESSDDIQNIGIRGLKPGSDGGSGFINTTNDTYYTHTTINDNGDETIETVNGYDGSIRAIYEKDENGADTGIIADYIYYNQESTNFDYIGIKTSISRSKPSAVPEVLDQKEYREPAAAKEVFTEATVATPYDFDNVNLRTELVSEFTEETVTKWEAQGTYISQAQDYLASQNNYIGTSPRIQETTNFAYGDYSVRNNKKDTSNANINHALYQAEYAVYRADDPETTINEERLVTINQVGENRLSGQEGVNFSYSDIFNMHKNEGNISIKNNMFTPNRTRPDDWLGDILWDAESDIYDNTQDLTNENLVGDSDWFTNPFIGNYGDSGWANPSYANVMVDENGNIKINQDNGLPDSREIGFGNAAKGFLVGGILNYATALGLEGTMDTLLSAGSLITDFVQDFSEFGEGKGPTINNLLVNGGRRLGSTELAMILANFKADRTITGDAGAGFFDALDSVDSSLSTAGNLMNHPVAWIMNKFRESDSGIGFFSGSAEAEETVNLFTQGTRGNLKGEGLFDFYGEEYDIAHSHATQFSSMAEFRNTVIKDGADNGIHISGLSQDLFEENRIPKHGLDGEDYAAAVPEGAKWKDFADSLGLSDKMNINKWTKDSDVAISFVPPTEYSAFLGEQSDGSEDYGDVWNINIDRATYRNSINVSKPFTNTQLNSDIFNNTGQEGRQVGFANYIHFITSDNDTDINGQSAPLPTNINMVTGDQDTELRAKSLFNNNIETGWSGDNLFSLFDADKLSDVSVNFGGINDFYKNIHITNSFDSTYDSEGKLSDSNIYGAKVTYKNAIKNSDATTEYVDPHIIDIKTAGSVRLNPNSLEGKDKFLKTFSVREDNSAAFRNWIPQNIQGDISVNANRNNVNQETSIFNIHALLGADSNERSNITAETIAEFSNIEREQTVNKYYSQLQENGVSAFIQTRYNQEYLKSVNGVTGFIDPHLADFQVKYTGSGDTLTEELIYDATNYAIGKDLFAKTLKNNEFFKGDNAGTAPKVYSWANMYNLTGDNFIDILGGDLLSDENTMFSTHYNANGPKNGFVVVNGKYRAKLRGAVSSTYTATGVEDFNRYRFLKDDGTAGAAINIKLFDDDGKPTDTDAFTDVKFFNGNNYAISSIAANVPTLIEYDTFTIGIDNTGTRGVDAPPNAPNAKSANQSAIDAIKSSSNNFKTVSFNTEDNLLLAQQAAIDIVPNENKKFVETEIGLVRKGGEVDFYSSDVSDRASSERKPTKREIKPQFYTDREVISYKQEKITKSNGEEVSVNTGVIEKTELQGATVGFQATEGTDDDDARYDPFDSSNPSNTTDKMISYRETENISVIKKSEYYTKIRDKWDVFATQNMRNIRDNNQASEKGCGFLAIIKSPAAAINGDNLMYSIPMQFNPEITGESRSANWSQHTAIGRTNEHFIWSNTASRTIQFKTTYAVVAPDDDDPDWFKDGGNTNIIYDSNEWGSMWTENNISGILTKFRGLLLPEGFSDANIDTDRLDGNRLSPPVITIFFGDQSMTLWNNTVGGKKTYATWIATDLNLDPRLEAGYTNRRNPRMYDVTMTLKEVAPSWQSYQSHAELGL